MCCAKFVPITWALADSGCEPTVFLSSWLALPRPASGRRESEGGAGFIVVVVITGRSLRCLRLLTSRSELFEEQRWTVCPFRRAAYASSLDNAGRAAQI